MYRCALALFVVMFAAVASTPSSAERARRQQPQQSGQYSGTQRDRDACAPDARRLCRKAGDDQNAVLSCLQLNKFKLRKPCRELLQSHGML